MAPESEPRWFTLPRETGDDEVRIGSLAVIGGGQMGAGIAEVAARAGLEVTVLERDAEAAERSRAAVAVSVERAAGRGRLGEPVEAVLDRIGFCAEWAGIDGAEAGIEAVVEDVEAKRRVFELMDRHLPGAAFLASNTSAVPIMKLAGATAARERVLGLHFFNPVPVMDLVEVVPSLATSEAAASAALEFVRGTLGKTAIKSPDRAGFVVNGMLVPYLLCAVRTLEMGPTPAEEIDRGMVVGCHHPMGPLALADLIGLDTVMAIAAGLHDEFGDQFYSAPPLLRRMVEAGTLGRKTGSGFYEYGKSDAGLVAAI